MKVIIKLGKDEFIKDISSSKVQHLIYSYRMDFCKNKNIFIDKRFKRLNNNLTVTVKASIYPIENMYVTYVNIVNDKINRFIGGAICRSDVLDKLLEL